jgi:hypothetical protein
MNGAAAEEARDGARGISETAFCCGSEARERFLVINQTKEKESQQ